MLNPLPFYTDLQPALLAWTAVLAILAFIVVARPGPSLQLWAASTLFVVGFFAVVNTPREVTGYVFTLIQFAAGVAIMARLHDRPPASVPATVWRWSFSGAYALATAVVAGLAFSLRDPDLFFWPNWINLLPGIADLPQ